MPFSVGDLIDGHYRVEARFAGGMGFVYIALDEIVGKRFAIKQLSELHAEDELLTERFRREASTWLQLGYHPHIVQAHSYLPRPEGAMLILEYVDGQSLDQLLKAEKRLAPALSVAFGRQFCEAMQFAHTCEIAGRGVGVLHRDIKPGNIMITRKCQIKVTDFGLAKVQGDVAKITGVGQYVGTVAYSSPEQLKGAGDVTRASDVYSFGAVLYQMLCGHAPFRGSNPAELFYAIQETPPKPLGGLCDGLDAALSEMVMRCLKKNAAERFGDFVELAAALAEVAERLDAPADHTCDTCGFTSLRFAAKCSVCGALSDPLAALSPAGSAILTAPPAGAHLDPAVTADEIICPEPGSRAEQQSEWKLDAKKEYLVQLDARGTVVPWRLERPSYTLGSDAGMTIRLHDPAVAPYQLFLVRLPYGWLALNRHPTSRVEVNGDATRQQLLRPGDLCRVGATWLAFAGPPSSQSVPLAPGHWIDRVDPKTVKSGGSTPTQVPPRPAASCMIECSGGKKFASHGEPLRLGTSALCEVRFSDVAIAPIQALVAWQSDGIHLFSLVGSAVRSIEGEVITDRVLRDGDLLQFGPTPLRVRIEGDPGKSARARRAAERPRRFAVTVLSGHQQGQTAVLPEGEKLIVGRHSDCDVTLATDTFISRRHLQMSVGPEQIELKDVGKRSGFQLNRTHHSGAAVAHFGDVLVVGKTLLLVHDEFALTA